MSKQDAVLGLEYARGREVNRALRYRLRRRAQMVVDSIQKFSSHPIKDILDLGTADAKVLHCISKHYPEARCVGIEFSQELVDYASQKFPHLEIRRGDMHALELPDHSFDIIIATAVIEHFHAPKKGMGEAWRVLRPGGLLIITSPDPFWEDVATKLGLLDDDQHVQVFTLRQLESLAQQCGFSIIHGKKFMLSPIGLPFEQFVENIIHRLGLDFFMANQLLVVRKP